MADSRGRYTVGDILKMHPQLRRSQVHYLLETRRITPIDRVATAHIYDDAAVAMILSAAAEIAANRGCGALPGRMPAMAGR